MFMSLTLICHLIPSDHVLSLTYDFYFVLVLSMYSCKNDVCGFTLSLYPDRESSKMLDHGGNRTYYFKNASQAQCSANGVIMARSVCECDVSKLKAETDRVRFDSATRIFDFQRLLTLILFYFSPNSGRTSAI